MRWAACFITLAAGLYAQSLQQAELLWKQHRYADANTEFRLLTAAHPDNPEYKVRWGRLLLERFNKKEAGDLFREALEVKKDYAPALLGLALAASEDYEQQAVQLAHKALEADPKLVEAQELLARMALEDTNEKLAGEEADKAIAMSPHALDAMAIKASIDWLNDRPDSPWMHKILEQDPHYGTAYETVAHFEVLNRRYEEGIEFYRKAIEIQPDLWSAHSQLGINLMRLGRDGEARAELVKAFQNGYTDSATANSLTLLDSYKNFNFYETKTTILKLHKKESELLRPYFEDEMKRIEATYDKKYKVHLDRPVQVEVYPDHEDFAVRTMGMPGLGALGVTFGSIVAMDSPTGRKPGSFHWASTLWHEMSHVYVLTATHHRVPRWFTEGLAVHEETAVSPEWGDRLDPQVIKAIKEKKLLPVAELDRGFIRPSYPSQVIVSYYQAGKICDYINAKWGWDKLLAMIQDFAKSEPTADVIRKELGIAPEEFDKQFLASIEAETKTTVDGFDDWMKSYKKLLSLASKKDTSEEFIREAKRVRDEYPDYVESGSVYELLAEAYLANQDKAAAIGELVRYEKQGGRTPATLKKLSMLLAAEGKKQEAAATLERLNFIAPQDDELHQRLGDLYMDLGNAHGAVREYTAALAEKPLDQATSHYNLARALRQANQAEKAREQLLLSLEAAPGYRPAQKMLLEISRKETEK